MARRKPRPTAPPTEVTTRKAVVTTNKRKQQELWHEDCINILTKAYERLIPPVKQLTHEEARDTSECPIDAEEPPRKKARTTSPLSSYTTWSFTSMPTEDEDKRDKLLAILEKRRHDVYAASLRLGMTNALGDYILEELLEAKGKKKMSVFRRILCAYWQDVRRAAQR